MLFLRQPEGRAARALTSHERRVVAGALSRCAVASPALCERAVDVAVLVPREPTLGEVRGPRSLVAHVALAARAEGITLGRRVFVRSEHVAPDGGIPIDLVAHEVAHVAQYLRDGTIAFCLRYAADYLQGRARGLDDHRAYLAIPYEVEARAVAAACVAVGMCVSGQAPGARVRAKSSR